MERYPRNWIAIIVCATWSGATALQGLAPDYGSVVISRAIVASSQAFFNPVAYTVCALVC